MTFAELENHYTTYTTDNSYGHRLFEECVQFAKHITDLENPDRLDIAHDASWKAWENFNTIPATTRFGPWFTRVVKNTQRDYYRKAKRRTKYEQADFAPCAAPFTLTEQHVMREAAGDHRALIDLLLQGFRMDEVADSLGVTVRTVRQRLASLRGGLQANA